MNKPKLVSSPTIKKVKDRQFYEMIIADAKRILPMVNNRDGICHLMNHHENMIEFKRVILKIAIASPRFNNSGYYGDPRRNGKDVRFTPAWKSDRIFLLNEIIKYCEYKLKEK